MPDMLKNFCVELKMSRLHYVEKVLCAENGRFALQMDHLRRKNVRKVHPC